MSHEDRKYQADCVSAIFGEWKKGNSSTLAVLPTGTGKTHIAGMVCRRALDEFGRRTLFLANRRDLVRQAANKLKGFGLNVGIEMGEADAFKAERESSSRFDVVCATVQSLGGERLTRYPRDHFGVVIGDEAHHGKQASFLAPPAWFKDRWLLGITATPDGCASGNLGAVFPSRAYHYALTDAVENGHVAPITRVTCPVSVDLRSIKTTGDDFNLGDLAERIGPHVEEIADAIQQEIGTRFTVVFTPDVGSAQALADVLTAKGVSARYCSGSGSRFGMSRSECDKVLDDFAAKKFQVIVCCDLLIEGWDCVHVSCVVIARPTLKRYRYVQMVGRGTRINKGVEHTDCLIVDLDWETDETSKNLICDVDLFNDGSVDPDAIEFGRKRAREGVKDVLSAIREGEEYVRTRQRLIITMTGRKAVYRKTTVDPVGVAKLLGVKFKSRYDMDKQGTNPASRAQIHTLTKMGVQNAEGLSKWGASKLIGKLQKRADQGLADTAKVANLVSRGVNSDLALVLTQREADHAAHALEMLAPMSQKALF